MIKKIKEIKNIILNIPNIEKLKKNGLKVGTNFDVQRGCIIDPHHCWLISIGNNVTLAPGVHILAHDASTKKTLGYTKIGLVNIGDNVFIGAHTTILPNVKIGNNVIIGANSIITRDIPNDTVAVGNPCRVVEKYDDFIAKNKKLLESKPKFQENWTVDGKIDNDKKEKMKKILLKEKIGFVR